MVDLMLTALLLLNLHIYQFLEMFFIDATKNISMSGHFPALGTFRRRVYN